MLRCLHCFCYGRHAAVVLLVASIGLHWLSRCPIVCFACSGDFYHTLNLGIPWQGKCVSSDVVLSVISLSFGACGVGVSLLRNIRHDLLGHPRVGLVWLGTGTLVIRRMILACALVFGVPSSFFDSYIASCTAIDHPAKPQRIAVVSSMAGMNIGPDVGQCLDLQQKAYTRQHAYELIRIGDCRDLFKSNADILPSLPPRIAAQLAMDGSHSYCKEAMLLVTLQRRPDIDWLFWQDYDAVITTAERKLEDFVPASEVDFVLTIGAEDSVGLELPAGRWHAVFPHVPTWSTTAGRFNSGAFMVRNSAAAKAKLRSSLTLDFGTDDQRALGTAIFSMNNASGTAASVDGDIIKMGSLALRALSPRCMNAHPMNWSPWGRWLPGDFISHNWGGNKGHFTFDACVEESRADWQTRALVVWNLRKGFLEGMLCAVMIGLIMHGLYQAREAGSLIRGELERCLIRGESDPLVVAFPNYGTKARTNCEYLP